MGQYASTTGSKAVWKVWKSSKGESGFEESWNGWVELGFLVVLATAEAMGWKWEAGLVDRRIEESVEKDDGVYTDNAGGLEDKEALFRQVANAAISSKA